MIDIKKLRDNPEFVNQIVSLGKQGLAGDQAMYDELEKVRARASMKLIDELEARTDITPEKKAQRLRELKSLYWKCLNDKHASKSAIRNMNISYLRMAESFQKLREAITTASGLIKDANGEYQ